MMMMMMMKKQFRSNEQRAFISVSPPCAFAETVCRSFANRSGYERIIEVCSV
jgi:hypothetical protein